jgi:hypothetical protein
MWSYVRDKTFAQAEYVRSYRPQLTEILSEFGPSDGSSICRQRFALIIFKDTAC